MMSQRVLPHWWSRSGGVAFFTTQVSVTHVQKPFSSESGTPAPPSTHQQTFQLQPSLTIILNARYVTYRNMCSAPRPPFQPAHKPSNHLSSSHFVKTCQTYFSSPTMLQRLKHEYTSLIAIGLYPVIEEFLQLAWQRPEA